MNTLDEDQLRVAKYKGNITVVAGPGSGKTRTLIERIKLLGVDTHFTQEDILVLSFSRSAVKTIKERLPDYLRDRFMLCTLHALAYESIKKSQNIFHFISDIQKEYLMR